MKGVHFLACGNDFNWTKDTHIKEADSEFMKAGTRTLTDAAELRRIAAPASWERCSKPICVNVASYTTLPVGSCRKCKLLSASYENLGILRDNREV